MALESPPGSCDSYLTTNYLIYFVNSVNKDKIYYIFISFLFTVYFIQLLNYFLDLFPSFI